MNELIDRTIADQAGVTLAEVAVGLLLTAVVALAATPVFSELLSTYHLRGATHEIFSELQRTRLAAVMKNNPYRFSITPGSGVYRIHDDANGDYVEDDGEVTLRDIGNDNGAVTLYGATMVTFLANGTALAPGEIMVANGDGETRTVSVGAGGSIRIQ